MDVIRTPYKRKAKIFKDSDIEVTLSWFAAPAGAKYFPFKHLFASGDWSSRTDEWIGPGESQSARRVWHAGKNPPHYLGQCFIGDPEWYLTGVPVEALSRPLAAVPECCRGFAVHGGPTIGGAAIVTQGNGPLVGGFSFSGAGRVSSGRLSVSLGGLAFSGAAAGLAGRGGWGVLWGGMGPGGLLIRGFDPPGGGGLSLFGLDDGDNEAINYAEGGLSLGGSAIGSNDPDSSKEGGPAWGGKATVTVYDRNAVFIPGCPNRIPKLMRAVCDQASGSLGGLVGSYGCGWQHDYVWSFAVPGLGNGTMFFTLDLSAPTLASALLSSNCIMGMRAAPLAFACQPFRLEFQQFVGGSQMLCSLSKANATYHIVISP